MNRLSISIPRLRRPLGAVLSLLLLASGSAMAADWYVATDGDDANPGTLEAPFASLMQAQAAASAGDTVHVRGGTYNTFTIAASDSNYHYVHTINKSDITYAAYPGETPLFDFSNIPTDLRVCGFYITASGITIRGFHVTGTPDGNQKQSECFRIYGSAASCDFYDCVAFNNAANGFYFTNHARGSCIRCDAYNNVGSNGASVSNTDGFGAHGNTVVFRYCRSWHNSDDGYDTISSDQNGAHIFDHCWAYDMTAGGDSNGFKIGGYGSGSVPPTVPVHTVMYCVAANNNAHGFYANHQPGQAAVWTHNTSFNHSAGNFDMLERVSPTDPTDIPGYREVLHYNISFQGTIIRDDATPPENATNNSWTIGATVTADDFLSLDASQLTAPRSAGNNMPFITFMHLAPGSDLAGLGAFEPPPPAPTDVQAAWVNSGRIDISWTASPGATEYYVERAETSGGPYVSVATRLTSTSFSDTDVGGQDTYYYRVYAMDDVSFDAGFSAEVAAVQPLVSVTGIDADTGPSDADGITSDPTLVISGMAGPGDAVAVRREDLGVIGNAVADAGGNWSFDYTGTALAEGTYNFAASFTDPVTGIEFISDPFAVTIDTTTPATPEINYAGSSPLVVTGTTEPRGEVVLLLDGSVEIGRATASEAGDWIILVEASISSGAHELTAIGTDLAGNDSAPSPAFSFDTSIAAPVIASAQGDAGTIMDEGFTFDPTLTFTGTAEPGAEVTFFSAGGEEIATVTADGAGAWTVDHTGTTLPQGANSFFARASHGAGDSLASPIFTVNVDSVAPMVSSIVRHDPTDEVITSATPSVVFRVTFDDEVSGVDTQDFLLVGSGNASGTIAAVSAGSGTQFDVTVNELGGEGTLRLDLKPTGTGITDAAGNPAPGFNTGESYTRVFSLAGSGTWIQPSSGGLWSEPANWFNATIPNGATHTADFSTLDLTAGNTVHLDSPRTVNAILFGDADPATAAGWMLDDNGNSANVLTLAGPVPTIGVDSLAEAATTTISAVLAGEDGLTKTGAGTLVLTAANPLEGSIITAEGILQLGPGGSLSPTTMAINTRAHFDLAGGTLTASGTTTISGANNTGLIVNDGIATLPRITFTNGSGGLFRINGGRVDVGDVTIPRSSDRTISFASGFVVTGGSSTVGTINLGTSNSNGAMSVEGGELTVTGPITVGNQVTGGRGGALRVIGGTFTSTDESLGLVFSKTNGANDNNVTFGTFSGGVSTIQKITLGFDSSVTDGSATITIDGGTVYLGAGGIVKNGTAGFETTLNFGAGTLGAIADWSTSLPITLPEDGNIVFKAADQLDAPFDITLAGALSGEGGFTKTGPGMLTLEAANTFTGPVNLAGGVLRVNGSLAAGEPVVLNGGTLAGTGTIDRPVVLNTAIIDASGAANFTINGQSLTWNGGGTLAFDLGADGVSGKLTLGGALLKGSAGTYTIAFRPGAGFAAGNSYTIATFASTDFSAGDFVVTGLPPGYVAEFSVTGTSLEVTIKAVASITLTDLTQAYDGTPRTPIAVTDPEGLTVVFTFDGETTPPIFPGTYDVVATIDDPIHAGSISGTFEITITALVRHAPGLNGDLDGSAQVLLPEDVTLNRAMISGDLLVPGTPAVVLNGHPTYGGTLDGFGDPDPTDHTVTLNQHAVLGHAIRRIDAIALPTVEAPPTPAGTRDVTINNPGQNVGDFATLRNLTLNKNAGPVAVPPGTYGTFIANGGTGFTFGVAGATEPAVYDLRGLSLNGGAGVRIVGPVIITLANGSTLNGGTVGADQHPEWLTLQIASGGLSLNSGATVHGIVLAPAGTVNLNSGLLHGRVSADRLTINSDGLLTEVYP